MSEAHTLAEVKAWIDKSGDLIRLWNLDEHDHQMTLSCRHCFRNSEFGALPWYSDNPECRNLLQLGEWDREYGNFLRCYEAIGLGRHVPSHNSYGLREVLSNVEWETNWLYCRDCGRRWV